MGKSGNLVAVTITRDWYRGVALANALMAFVCVATLSLASGCGEQGIGELTGGPLLVGSCASDGDLQRFDPLAIDLTFMALERDSDVVLMRFAPVPSLIPVNDNLTITVEDFGAIRAEIETAGRTSRTHQQGLRVGLNLGSTCPGSNVPMVARYATVTFDALSVNGGQRVVFNVVFDLFDERAGVQVGWNLSARGDFEVKLGTPYQVYSDPSAQKH